MKMHLVFMEAHLQGILLCVCMHSAKMLPLLSRHPPRVEDVV
jgi:hypothetical protein